MGVQDPTRASGALIRAYIVELLRQLKKGEDEDIAAALDLGVKAGALTVGSMGSIKSVPRQDDIDKAEKDFRELDNRGMKLKLCDYLR